jgi:ABC-type antimicrobial peptide transport system permease subunit
VNSGPEPVALWNRVSSDYFAMLGVPLLAGRSFTDRDTNPSPNVAMINETFAKKYFPGRNPIAIHIGFGANVPTNDEGIGIVKDVKYRNLRDEIPAQAYYPYLAATHFRGMTVYLRSSIAPAQLIGTVRETVRQLDPNIPIFDLRTTDEVIDRSLKTERLVASLSTVFSGLATLLAIIGLYSVMAYTVARRTREIGIRVALRAMQGKVIWLVMREVLMP